MPLTEKSGAKFRVRLPASRNTGHRVQRAGHEPFDLVFRHVFFDLPRNPRSAGYRKSVVAGSQCRAGEIAVKSAPQSCGTPSEGCATRRQQCSEESPLRGQRCSPFVRSSNLPAYEQSLADPLTLTLSLHLPPGRQFFSLDLGRTEGSATE